MDAVPLSYKHNSDYLSVAYIICSKYEIYIYFSQRWHKLHWSEIYFFLMVAMVVLRAMLPNDCHKNCSCLSMGGKKNRIFSYEIYWDFGQLREIKIRRNVLSS